MRILTTSLLLIFLTTLGNAQNIYSALHLNEEREYKTARPERIIETNTFYNSGGKKTVKNIKIFDAAGMLLMEERNNEDGVLEARLTYTNDTINRRILTRTMERWISSNSIKETAFYSYDSSGFLTGITDKDAKGNTFQFTKLVCNSKGHPVELTLYDRKGKRYGTEIAEYLYDRNMVATAVILNDGRVSTHDTIKISFRNASAFPNEKETYNATGDLTSSVSKNFDGSETIFEEEYVYDRFGNCTEHTIYKVTVKGNGKRKRTLNRIFRKEYIY